MNKGQNPKISKALIGNTNKKGFVYSDELKEKIRKQKIEKGFKGPTFGKKVHSEEHKQMLKESRLGVNNPMWKSGRVIDNRGYVKIYSPDHPNNVHNYVFEHRLVMEKKLGRLLNKNELVHHKNAIKGDNRLSNLIVLLRKVHFGEVDCPNCLYKFLIK